MKIYTLFAHPKFDDPDQDRDARLLYGLLWVTIATFVFWAFGAFIFQPETIDRVIIPISLIILISCTSLALLRRHYLRTASLLFVLQLWLAVTISAITGGGMGTPAVQGYLLVILAAGLLMGWRSGLLTTLICIATQAVLAYAETTGLLPIYQGVRNPLTYLIVYTLISSLVVIFVYYYTSNIRTALNLAKQELSERKRAEEKIRSQLAHLTALSEIDHAITSGFDLRLNLTTLLIHAIAQLGIDAADVLLFDSSSLTLQYSAYCGFQSNSPEHTQPRLDRDYSGRVILDRQIIGIPNIKDQHDDRLLTSLWTDEGFVGYYGVPLIAKGQIMGVLEIFKRAPLEPDAEWLDFLKTLAGQAAIAIDNSSLFINLQRSNAELSQAYDATIEGWSYALDLRDRETKGHTQRVTEMAMKLARIFNLTDDELTPIRRGALLHDIGKMGVPDSILHKSGPLTEEEWVMMRKHPTFAYELLSPIDYLHDALDIPYCHHEKWDGTGYPRGLKGEEIPLAARLFAVVDVWDALRSDRPYRAAWPEEKVREHIQSLAGTHFDPQVVKLFLDLVIPKSRKHKKEA